MDADIPRNVFAEIEIIIYNLERSVKIAMGIKFPQKAVCDVTKFRYW